MARRSLTRILAGAQAKEAGSSFETVFEDRAATYGMGCSRVPDGCKQVGPHKLIRCKTPFDFILSWSGRTAMIDTKSCAGDTFPNSKIDSHQVKELAKHSSQGILSGYVILLRSDNVTLFVPAHVLQSATGRGSISSDHPGVRVLGTAERMDLRLLFGAARAPHYAPRDDRPSGVLG